MRLRSIRWRADVDIRDRFACGDWLAGRGLTVIVKRHGYWLVKGSVR